MQSRHRAEEFIAAYNRKDVPGALATAICSTATSRTNRIVEINSGSKFDGISFGNDDRLQHEESPVSECRLRQSVSCWLARRPVEGRVGPC